LWIRREAMTVIQVIVVLVLGIFLGWTLYDLYGKFRYRAIRSLENLVEWLLEDDTDKKMYLIVRKAYGGKRHIAKNPTRKKTPEFYPISGE
jgi:hypothetical protein